MANYDQSRAEHDLAELRVMLPAWYQNRDSDSVTIQDLRSAEYDAASRMMEGLVEGVQPERTLQLKVGETALEAARFRRTAYDRLDMGFRTLEPHSELELRKASIITYGYTRKQELFAGFVTRVALSEIAKTLTENGELSMIGITRPAVA